MWQLCRDWKLSGKWLCSSSQDDGTCFQCGKRVYEMEKITADDIVYHKSCFRCSLCNRVLRWAWVLILMAGVTCVIEWLRCAFYCSTKRDTFRRLNVALGRMIKLCQQFIPGSGSHNRRACHLYNKRRYVCLSVCLSVSMFRMAGQTAGPIETKLDTRTHVYPGSVSVKVNVKVIHVCVREWQNYETPGTLRESDTWRTLTKLRPDDGNYS